MEIRRITKTDDLEKIGNIYAQSWKTAYKGIVPQSYLDALSGSRWSAVLLKSDYAAYVITAGGEYIGTSSICAAREQNMEGWGEIISIYLLPEYFGTGYAGMLLAAVMDALLSDGYKDIYLWVLQENKRAQRFYEKHGFRQTPDRITIEIAGKELTEVRFVYRSNSQP